MRVIVVVAAVTAEDTFDFVAVGEVIMFVNEG
jgi:hypothetical protein